MARKDFFRDTSIRYLGYANEVGEALRPLISREAVRASYGIAIGYIVADTADKALQKLAVDRRPWKVLWATGDALIWQSLASIIIPGFAINRIVHYSGIGLCKYVPQLNVKNRAYTSVGIGLLAIPFIIRPIDRAVDIFMNMTYRQIFY